MISCFAFRQGTVVAGITTADYFIMINLSCRRPAGFRMTAFTQVTGAYVLTALTTSRRTIMTACTGRQWFRVLSRRAPCIGAMT